MRDLKNKRMKLNGIHKHPKVYLVLKDIGVLVLITAIFLGLGSYFFSKIEA